MTSYVSLTRVSVFSSIILTIRFYGCVALFNCITSFRKSDTLCEAKNVSVYSICILNKYIPIFDILEWRRMDEPIGTCHDPVCRGYVCEYSCNPLNSFTNLYSFDTCGLNCFSLGIKWISPEDISKYYINVSSQPDSKNLALDLMKYHRLYKNTQSRLLFSYQRHLDNIIYYCYV